ncbi:hypothetical protein TNIN_129511 [Trichonephila inaurata madagascariensis]|uniref:DUF4817 domain-containing protein n=1 Tax=Trichonephila inaurata madagascariensis TaxID=2747483 RepID=A0A8X6WSR4_9ARAC|nr:hypothetical protein TNIN_129511 [Trichonephila inaurata madagascariensis]
MKPYSTKQRVKIIKFFYSCQRSIVMTHGKYRQYFNLRSAPTAFMIRSLVGRFEVQWPTVLEEAFIEIFTLKTTWKLCGRVLQMIHLSQLAIVAANWAFPERH